MERATVVQTRAHPLVFLQAAAGNTRDSLDSFSGRLSRRINLAVDGPFSASSNGTNAFRSDVNANGAINATDVLVIKSNTGTGLAKSCEIFVAGSCNPYMLYVPR